MGNHPQRTLESQVIFSITILWFGTPHAEQFDRGLTLVCRFRWGREPNALKALTLVRSHGRSESESAQKQGAVIRETVPVRHKLIPAI
jgi:hypothetical protein